MLRFKTPGNVVDYDWMIEYLINERKVSPVEEVGTDPWNATQVSINLINEGFEVVEVPQNPKHLSEPTKFMMELVVDQKVIIEDNPVLNWAVSNAVAKEDANGNIMLNKGKSTKRIDPIAAIITGLSRAILKNGGSVYDDHGIEFL